MKIVPENATLVIAGSWNPAILTPNWIARTAIAIAPAEPFNVRVEMAVLEGGVQKYSFLGLSYIVSPQFLVFFLNGNDPEVWGVTARTARAILATLTHTPVTGVGFNLEYRIEEFHHEFVSSFSSALELDEVFQDGEIVSKTWGNKIKHGDALVTFTCEHEGGVGKIGLNYHLPTQSTEEAAAFLADERYPEVLKLSNALAQKLSNENFGD